MDYFRDCLALISTIASVMSALCVYLAYRQLQLTKVIAQTQFEDTIGKEYRDLTLEIPVAASLGEAIPDEEFREAFDNLFRYIDLSNEQVFLRVRKRVSLEVWKYWCDGIRANLALPAFARAWKEVQKQSNNFKELRRLVSESFERDPAEW